MSIVHGVNPSAEMPIGLLVTRTAKTLSRAFDDALVEAGGSMPTWLVLLALKTGQGASQRVLAEQLGIKQPTLVHHLNSLETAGLITRAPHPDDRRAQRLVLSKNGEAMFHRLREVAMQFDKKVRRGVPANDVARLRVMLATLAANAAG